MESPQIIWSAPALADDGGVMILTKTVSVSVALVPPENVSVANMVNVVLELTTPEVRLMVPPLPPAAVPLGLAPL